MDVYRKLKEKISLLFRPSSRFSIFTLVCIGLITGVLGILGFNYSLEATNTEPFCTSCHEMYAQPFQTVQTTAHYNNKTGVRPTCSDCHVPKEFIPKMIRKIEAANEVWGHLIGRIDTPEKYQAYLPELKKREIARMRANDSSGCRSCHDTARMTFELQSAKAQQYHGAMKSQGKTCIDCHQGIAHTYVEAKTPE